MFNFYQKQYFDFSKSLFLKNLGRVTNQDLRLLPSRRNRFCPWLCRGRNRWQCRGCRPRSQQLHHRLDVSRQPGDRFLNYSILFSFYKNILLFFSTKKQKNCCPKSSSPAQRRHAGRALRCAMPQCGTCPGRTS